MQAVQVQEAEGLRGATLMMLQQLQLILRRAAPAATQWLAQSSHEFDCAAERSGCGRDRREFREDHVIAKELAYALFEFGEVALRQVIGCLH